MQAGELIPVKVLVRCRPLVEKEVLEGCSVGVDFYEEYQQVSLPDLEKAFTFDHVFPPTSTQEQVYTKCSPDLLTALFNGYNATILAYGQTGSGKTFTMGTAYSSESSGCPRSLGVIPRVIGDLFQRLESSSGLCYKIKVSFLEIYNEDVYDLLSSTHECVTVREDNNGIKVVGMQEVEVSNQQGVLEQLVRGSSNRKTGSTNMNKTSSRSHALFTITVQLKTSSSDTTSKFQLVDLAGSEKAKKTGAQGDRFKEGVNINRGLFALGNVISALCDRSSHVPYRDSRLTRLLQDSLGGNSHTVMIACVSPATSNLEETLNTLRYADRARKIKNRPIVNVRPEDKELSDLKQKYRLLEEAWKEHMESCPKKRAEGKSPEATTAARATCKAPPPSTSTSSREKGREKKRSAEKASQSSPSLGEKAAGSTTTTGLTPPRNKDLEKELKSLSEANNQLLLNWAESQAAANSYLKRIEQMEDALKDWKERFEGLTTEIKKMEGQESEGNQAPPPELLDSIRKFSQAIEYYEESAEQSMKPLPQVNVDELSEIESCLKTLDENLQDKEAELIKSQEHSSDLEPLRKMAESQQLQIDRLEREKAELEAYLKKNPSAKISEDRRRRIGDLERQVSLLKKQLEMNTKALKSKEVVERKAHALSNEIMALKKSRVAMQKRQELIQKQVREEKLRAAQQAAQATRKVNTLLFSNQKLSCQKNVLEQKLREADLSKKRLETLLAKREAARALKGAAPRAHAPGAAAKALPKDPLKIHDFLDAELEFTVRSHELKQHLEELQGERESLAAKLADLNKQLDDSKMEPPVKKSLSGDESLGYEDVDVKRRDLKESIQFVQESLRVRDDQITKLLKQTILFDSEEQKEHMKKFFECPEDVEVGLFYLFQKSAEECKEASRSKSAVHRIEEKLSDEEKKVSKLEKVLKETERQHEVERLQEKQLNQTRLSVLEKEHRTKLLEYLQDASSISLYSIQEGQDSKLLEQFQKQATQINSLNDIQDELKKKTEECDVLQKEIRNLQQQKKGSSSRRSFFSGCNLSSVSLLPDAKPKTKKHSSAGASARILSLPEEEEDISEHEDDDKKDPDWTKTPVYKGGRRTTRLGDQIPKVELMETDSNSESDETATKKKALKRSTSSSSCKCGQTACKNNLCSCRKKQAKCTELCKCTASSCQNGKPDEESKDQGMLDKTFLMSSSSPLAGIENIPEMESRKTPEGNVTQRKLYSSRKSTLFSDPL